jgi:hypothetical protein
MNGIAKVGATSQAEIARSRTNALRLALRCEDPVARSQVAIYTGGERYQWYMPPGAAYRFFDDAIAIYPRGLNAGKQSVFVVGYDIFDGFPEHRGIKPSYFGIYQHGFDPELERKRGKELPVHFHWVELDAKHPATHCSTEPSGNNLVEVIVCRADPNWDSLAPE